MIITKKQLEKIKAIIGALLQLNSSINPEVLIIGSTVAVNNSYNASIIQPCPKTSEIDKIAPTEVNSYLVWLKNQENPSKIGLKDDKFYPINAPEDNGGFDIGYGHKIQNAKQYADGLTEPEVTALLKEDVATKLEDVKKIVEKQYPGEWDKLNDKSKLFLTDYQFNTSSGLKGFPKMLDAVVNDDWASVTEEYKRTWKEGAEVRELTKRNNATYETFIKPNLDI